MSRQVPRRVGLIGYGQIGASLCKQMLADPSLGLEPCFVFEADPGRAREIPAELRLESMDDFPARRPDLVVEAAHPLAVKAHGAKVLAHCNLLTMSVSALADGGLEKALKEACQAHGTRLYIPHGAVLGLDGLRDGLSVWERVAITMKKNPRNLSFAAAGGIKAEDITRETVVYDGPTRGILPLYPKNVNSHATLALATLGLDRTRSVLVADPSLEESVIIIEAEGQGNSIRIERRNPIKGSAASSPSCRCWRA